MKCSLTILFEDPFWIGLYERFDNDKYEVCKITFGAEPKDYEVYEFLLKNWGKLKFSPPIKNEVVEERRISPKRMQREINNHLQNRGIGTKAQQALKLQHEQNKVERKTKAENSVKLNRNVNMPYGKKRKRLNIGGDKMVDEQWIYCPVCSNKTRIKVRYNTELKIFPCFAQNANKKI